MLLHPTISCSSGSLRREYEPEILYKLYLIYKDTDPAKSESYATLLKEKHPDSTFAKILENPDFLKESSQAVEKQKELYKTAYGYFITDADYAASSSIGASSELGTDRIHPFHRIVENTDRRKDRRYKQISIPSG